MIKFRCESEEVLYPVENIVFISDSLLNELKRLALLNSRQRVRMCAHSSPNDSLHEMFIVHTKDTYIRPHKHIEKSESMMILEGEADVVLFHEDGSLRQVIQMGERGSGKPFYQRLPESVFHTLIIRSDFLVFYEVTEGPFLREKTDFPEWAPEEHGVESITFINRIELLNLNSRGILSD